MPCIYCTSNTAALLYTMPCHALQLAAVMYAFASLGFCYQPLMQRCARLAGRRVRGQVQAMDAPALATLAQALAALQAHTPRLLDAAVSTELRIYLLPCSSCCHHHHHQWLN